MAYKPGGPSVGGDMLAKLQLSRTASGSAADKQAKPHFGLMRESSFRATLQSMRRRSSVSASGGDGGFTTFTSGIRGGWQRELASPKFRQAVAAEFVATAIFVAVGSASVVFSYNSDPLAIQSTKDNPFAFRMLLAFTFGLMISVLVFSTGGISGGNLNPAVTVSLTVTRKMSLLRCFCYVVAQCLGAVAGAAFTWSLSPSLFDDAGGAINIVNRSSSYVTTWTAVGGEMLGTGLLVFTICAAADVGREKDNKYVGALTPLNIGFAVLAAHLALLNVDGCSINPARSFGTAVVSRVWTDHWVFWVGPLVGGPVTAIIYELVFKAGRDEDEVAAGGEGSVGGGGGPPQVATSAGSSVGAPSPAMGPAAGGAVLAGGPLEHGGGSSNASLLAGRAGANGGYSHHGSGELPPDYSLATASSLSLPPPTPPQRGGLTYPGSPGGQSRALLVGQQMGAGGTAREAVSSTASAAGDGGAPSARSRGGRVAMAMGGAGGSNANLLAAVGGGVGGEVVANPLQHPIFSAAGAPPPPSSGLGGGGGGSSSSAASYGFQPAAASSSAAGAGVEPPNAFSPSSQGDWR